MKILSLWQPWASLFVHGEKKIETRSWRVPRSIAMPFQMGVHAGKMWTEELEFNAQHEPFQSAMDRLGLRVTKFDYSENPKPFMPFGALLGTVEIYGCVYTDELLRTGLAPMERDFGDYSTGRFGWLARNFQPFKEPVPMRGAQGLFDRSLWDLCSKQ